MMIQKWFLFSLLMVLISAIVIAEGDFATQVNDLKSQVEGQELTGLVAKLFANDNINIYVKMENGQQQVVGVVTKDKKVSSINIGAVEKPTLKIYTDDKTVAEIQSATNSIGALQSVLREKKVTYEAVGFFNKIKFAFISAFARMSSKELKEEKLTDVNEEKKEEKKEEPKVVVGETKDNVEVVGEVKPEVKPEEIKKLEMVKENETAVNAEIPEEETKTEGVVHTILIKKEGFEPTSLTIKKGDTVEWKNGRDSAARLNKAMIVGTQLCSKIKSKILNSGESFKWTFEKTQTCSFADGIDTMKLMKVTVE